MLLLFSVLFFASSVSTSMLTENDENIILNLAEKFRSVQCIFVTENVELHSQNAKTLKKISRNYLFTGFFNYEKLRYFMSKPELNGISDILERSDGGFTIPYLSVHFRNVMIIFKEKKLEMIEDILYELNGVSE